MTSQTSRSNSVRFTQSRASSRWRAMSTAEPFSVIPFEDKRRLCTRLRLEVFSSIVFPLTVCIRNWPDRTAKPALTRKRSWIDRFAASSQNWPLAFVPQGWYRSHRVCLDRGGSSFHASPRSQRQAITSISTSDLPGIPPAAAIVVRTGGSGPNFPSNTLFIAS